MSKPDSQGGLDSVTPKEWDDVARKMATSFRNHGVPSDIHDAPEYKFSDPVKEPSHYTKGKIECIDYIREAVPCFKSFCMGNVIKYVHRHNDKGTPRQDLLKARVYLDWLIEEVSRDG
jgi:hypothetical protein